MPSSHNGQGCIASIKRSLAILSPLAQEGAAEELTTHQLSEMKKQLKRVTEVYKAYQLTNKRQKEANSKNGLGEGEQVRTSAISYFLHALVPACKHQANLASVIPSTGG